MKNAKFAFFASVGVVAALIALLAWSPWDPRRGPGTDADGGGPTGDNTLVVYCAAGLRVPVEAAAAEYERAYGVRVQLQYGGSQTLLANLKLSGVGDLYLPAEEAYIDLARKDGLVAETLPLATMRPLLAVRAGNPKAIRSLDDLLAAGDLKLALADPDAAAVGRLTREALRAVGKWDAVYARAAVVKPTVTEVATDVKLGAVDAAFIWDATVNQFAPALEGIELPELAGRTALVSVGVLKSAAQPTHALRFARYLAARDRGLAYFQKAGFKAVAGDVWAEEPRVIMYNGAMLQPAIEETIAAFERREGCRVDRVYNGCGILVGQMKAGQRPDTYFACDQSFMKQVADLFPEPVDVSVNQLVILVHKGNPQGIKALKDLARPGLKVGVGHEKQCALGALTEETLKQDGIYNAVRRNVAVESPTGDLLVNQLLAGSLDAVIAYVSNATGHADSLHPIKINIPCALAVQPIGVSPRSDHRQLAARLAQSLQSDESRGRFEAYGFRWHAAMTPALPATGTPPPASAATRLSVSQ